MQSKWMIRPTHDMGFSIDKSPARVIFENCVLHSLSEWVLARRRRISHETSKTCWFNFELPQARITTLKKKHLKAQYRYQKCYIYTTYMCIYTVLCTFELSILQFVRLPINFRAPDSGNISQNVKRIGFPGNLTNPMKSFNQLKSLGGSSLPGCKVAAGSPALKKAI